MIYTVGWLVLTSLSTLTPGDCTLGKEVKVFAAGKWSKLPSGTPVVIDHSSGQWTHILVNQKPMKVATSLLSQACPAEPDPVSEDSQEELPVAKPAPQLEMATLSGGAPVVLNASVSKTTPAKQPAADKSPPAVETKTKDVVTAPVEPVVAPSPTSAVEAPAATPTETLAMAQPVEAVTEAASSIIKKMVAVLDIKGAGPLTSTANALTTLVVAEVATQPSFKAVSRNELQALIAHQADASMLGCETVNCLANVGKLADAELVIAGTVEQVDGAHVVSLSLIDPAGPTIKGREEAVWRGSADDMLMLMRPMVERLLAGPEAKDHKGRLEVLAADGAMIVLDGKEVGRAPLATPVADLTTGVHTLHVTMDNALPFSSDVVVSRNETTIARVELEEIPIHHRPLFWVGVGSAALVAGGAAVGVTTWAILQQDQNTEVVLAPKP